jgi:transcriptional regulator with XRE-family HTH domain
MENLLTEIIKNDSSIINSTDITSDSTFLSCNFQGAFLKQKRERNNLSINETAKLTGFKNLRKTAGIIKNIETGTITIPPGYKTQLFKILNINSVEWEKETGNSNPENEAILVHNQQILNNQLKIRLNIITLLPELFIYFNEIKNTCELYFATVPAARISVLFSGKPESDLYLGELLTLWKNGNWRTVCSSCKGELFIFSAGGSPLSGSGSAVGICRECGQQFCTNQNGKFTRLHSALSTLNKKQKPKNCIPVTIEQIITVLTHQ